MTVKRTLLLAAVLCVLDLGGVSLLDALGSTDRLFSGSVGGLLTAMLMLPLFAVRLILAFVVPGFLLTAAFQVCSTAFRKLP